MLLLFSCREDSHMCAEEMNTCSWPVRQRSDLPTTQTPVRKTSASSRLSFCQNNYQSEQKLPHFLFHETKTTRNAWKNQGRRAGDYKLTQSSCEFTKYVSWDPRQLMCGVLFGQKLSSPSAQLSPASSRRFVLSLKDQRNALIRGEGTPRRSAAIRPRSRN